MQRKSVPRTGTARNVQPHRHDPYERRVKSSDALVCGECGVVCHGGRWYWGTAPLCDEQATTCPACERIRDRYPAGRVQLRGLPAEDRDAVLQLVRNIEAREKQEHPLERLIEVSHEEGGDVLVTTTGMHLARCIAAALRRRSHGRVEIHYAEGENLVRIEYRG